MKQVAGDVVWSTRAERVTEQSPGDEEAIQAATNLALDAALEDIYTEPGVGKGTPETILSDVVEYRGKLYARVTVIEEVGD